MTRNAEKDAGLRGRLSEEMFGTVDWDNLVDGRWKYDPKELCDHLAGVVLESPLRVLPPTETEEGDR